MVYLGQRRDSTLSNSEFVPQREFAADNNLRFTETQSQWEQTSNLLTYAVPGTIVGLADTIGQSVGILDENEMLDIVRDFPNFANTYEVNRDQFQTIGDLAGFWVPGGLAVKAISGGGRIARSLFGANRIGRSIFTSGKTATQLTARVRRMDQLLARAGEFSIPTNPARIAAASQAMRIGVVDSIKRTTAFEFGVYAAMSESDTLFPDEFGLWDYALYTGAPAGVGVFVEWAFMKGILRRSIRNVAVRAFDTRNPTSGLDEIVTRNVQATGEGDRSVFVTTGLINNAQLDTKLAERVTDTGALSKEIGVTGTKATNLGEQITINNSRIKDQFVALGHDNVFPRITSRHTMTPAQLTAARTAGKQDPSTFLGATSFEPVLAFHKFDEFKGRITQRIGKLNTDITKQQEALTILQTKGIDDVVKENDLIGNITKLQRERDFLAEQGHFVVEPDGSVILAQLRKETAFDTPQVIKTTARKEGEAQLFSYDGGLRNPRVGARKVEMGVSEDFILTVTKPETKTSNIVGGVSVSRNMPKLRGRAQFQSLDLFERTGVYQLFRKAVDKWNPKTSADIIVNNKSHHTQLDAVFELLHRPGVDDHLGKKIQMPNEWIADVQKLQLASLDGKYKEYKELAKLRDLIAEGSVKVSKTLQPNVEDIRKMLNLPGSGTGDASGIVQLFETLYQQDRKSLYDLYTDLNQVKRQTFDLVQFPEITKELQNLEEIALTGNALKMPEKSAPFMMMKRAMDGDSYTRRAMAMQVAANDAMRHAVFRDAGNAGAHLVDRIYKTLAENTASVDARAVNELVDGVIANRGSLVQQRFAARGVRPIEAASLIEALTTREARTFTGNLYAEPRKWLPNQMSFDDLWSSMRSAERKGDLFSFAQYVQARRFGWALKPETVAGSNRGVSFKLNMAGQNGVRNRKRFREIFGRNMDEKTETLMPMIKHQGDQAVYSPLEITEYAGFTAKSIQDLGQETLRNTNHLKKVLNKGPINMQPWWIPPRNLSRGSVRYMLDDTGNLKTVIHGRTDAEVERKVLQLQKEVPEFANSQAITQERMGRYFDVQDEAFMKLLDFSDPINQTGAARGKTSSQLLETGPDVMNGLISSINQQFENITRRSRATFFEPQVAYARRMSQVTGRKDPDNVWNKYLNTIYGSQNLDPRTKVGGIYNRVEDLYDTMLNQLHDNVFRPVSESTKALRETQAKEYDFLSKNLPESFMPFENAAEFIAKTQHVELPTNMKQHTATLNQVTSALTLRMFEVGHALLNMTSLAAVQPAVVRALNKRPGESLTEWRTRINAFGLVFDDLTDATGAVKVPQFSAARLLTASTHHMFTKDGQAVWREASKRGFMDQEVAELMRTITAPQRGFARNIISKGVDLVSTLSDKSERLSRGISFMSGYYIAKRGLGIRNQDDAFAFAHRFANDVIGDYRPNNRPRIFQGAVGMPLGLFQTYTFNYYQRIFDYIENADTKALAVQAAMQGSLFGAKTIPGFDLYVNTFASNYDGTVNPVDGMQNKFGREFSDWMLYGTLSNIPKLFGAEDGVSLYSRGDLNVQRLPGIWSIDKTPAANLIKSAYNIVDRSVGMMRQQGFSTRQMAEILATNSISRPLRNVIELSLGGRTDPRGALVQDDVRSGLSVAARISGLRPLNEAKQDEAYYRIRSTQFHQASRMRELREATRAAIRPNGSIDEAEIRRSIHQYIRYGGNPGNLAQWFKDQYYAALVPRSVNVLREAYNDPTRLNDILRLVNAGAINDEDFK